MAHQATSSVMLPGRVVLALAVALSVLSGCTDDSWPRLASVPGTPPDTASQEEFDGTVEELLEVREAVEEELESWPYPETGN